MAIGVYRIYVGSGWTEPDTLRRLSRLLDRLQGFLYRIDRLPEPDLQDGPESDAMLRARVRIALTQAHLAILHPSQLISPNAQARAEIDIARTGFRRRIPILGVTELPIPQDTDACSPSMDRVVTLDQNQIANAIQELAEQAAAERRKMTDSLFEKPNASIEPSSTSASKEQVTDLTDSPRALPIAEIMAAFEALKSEKTAHEQPR